MNNISAKVLSSELKKLKENHLFNRKVYADQTPVIVEYIRTEYSQSIKEIISALAQWGENHKEKVTSNNKKENKPESELT
jgi:DNA-binding HxlR family transcriptional regulator